MKRIIEIIICLLSLCPKALVAQSETSVRAYIDTLDVMDRLIDACTRAIDEVEPVTPHYSIRKLEQYRRLIVFLNPEKEKALMQQVLSKKFNCDTSLKRNGPRYYIYFNATDTIKLSTLKAFYRHHSKLLLKQLNLIEDSAYSIALHTYLNNYHTYLDKLDNLYSNMSDNNFIVDYLTHYYQAKQLLLNSKNGLLNAINFKQQQRQLKTVGDSVSAVTKTLTRQMDTLEARTKAVRQNVETLHSEMTANEKKQKRYRLTSLLLQGTTVVLLLLVLLSVKN